MIEREESREEKISVFMSENKEPVVLVRDVNVSPLVYDEIFRLGGQFFGKKPPSLLG